MSAPNYQPTSFSSTPRPCRITDSAIKQGKPRYTPYGRDHARDHNMTISKKTINRKTQGQWCRSQSDGLDRFLDASTVCSDATVTQTEAVELVLQQVKVSRLCCEQQCAVEQVCFEDEVNFSSPDSSSLSDHASDSDGDIFGDDDDGPATSATSLSPEEQADASFEAEDAFYDKVEGEEMMAEVIVEGMIEVVAEEDITTASYDPFSEFEPHYPRYELRWNGVLLCPCAYPDVEQYPLLAQFDLMSPSEFPNLVTYRCEVDIDGWVPELCVHMASMT